MSTGRADRQAIAAPSGVICLQSLGSEQTLALCSWFCFQTRGRSSPNGERPRYFAKSASSRGELNTCAGAQRLGQLLSVAKAIGG